MQSERQQPASFNFEVKPHILIVEARYYDDLANLQLDGAKTVLDRAGASYEVLTVPGALEIPAAIVYALKALDYDAVRRRYDGYVALGAVIKGGTMHDQIVATESARGLQELSMRYALAIGNGILTCDNKDQALERADKTKLNRSGEAAEACLRMIEIKQQFRLLPKKRWIAR
ncbi:MAG: 6,7-dimethyl-8-ribityllumazine synthase [Alphaproteobacteria bacterium]|nr:6,7-dimethyl-8-ribityllumazine synthase [Alphaproteobacteria bacterium]MBV8549523.1 6,7-dimethyl-8-ribityllumazine synthase [Alphaproteobacteria bacterium]